LNDIKNKKVAQTFYKGIFFVVLAMAEKYFLLPLQAG